MSRPQSKQGRHPNRQYAATEHQTLVSRKLMVCAIDFGTTYSGYAYSMNNDPRKIFCDHWNSGTSTLISYKTPTTVLLDAKQEFLAFGYEAERMYLDLVEEEEDNNLYYFRRFKMILYDKARTEVSIFVLCCTSTFFRKKKKSYTESCFCGFMYCKISTHTTLLNHVHLFVSFFFSETYY